MAPRAKGIQGKQRDPAKETYWRKVVEAQGTSGKSVRAFCQARGLSESSFHHWRRELRHRGLTPASPPTSAAFTEVRLTHPLLPQGTVEVVRGSLTIRFRGRCDASLLREAVSLLDEAAC